MSMAFDSVLVAALARELDARLRDARLRAVRWDRPGRSVALLFREGTLRFGLHPAAGAVSWHEPVEPGAGDRPLAARVRRVEAIPDDRVLHLALLRVRGTPAAADLFVEWIQTRWNAVLTEGTDRIVRHALADLEGGRAARTGHPWTPPAPSRREGGDGVLDARRWHELTTVDDDGGRRRALLSRVAWTSPVSASALLDAGGYDLWRRLAAVALGRSAPAPVALRRPGGVQPYPLPLAGTEGEPVASLLDAFALAADEAEAAPTLLPAALVDALREREVRAWARAGSLRQELAEAPDPERVRARGDLLLARLARVPRGLERVTLDDFEGGVVEIALDPTRSPQENAAALYEEAARADRARARLPGLIAAAEAEARRLAALLERARAGDATADELRQELPAGTGAGEETGPALPYRLYRSSGGLEIRVGRGARHNDDLTFHHSAPDDVWLHARHTAGAHVVLRWRGEGSPPPRDLAEAAVLAALHSKARTSGSVPVDWTRRKHVRKPRKAPPGQVLVERARTLFVEPDPAVEERLRVEGTLTAPG